MLLPGLQLSRGACAVQATGRLTASHAKSTPTPSAHSVPTASGVGVAPFPPLHWLSGAQHPVPAACMSCPSAAWQDPACSDPCCVPRRLAAPTGQLSADAHTLTGNQRLAQQPRHGRTSPAALAGGLSFVSQAAVQSSCSPPSHALPQRRAHARLREAPAPCATTDLLMELQGGGPGYVQAGPAAAAP